MWSKPTDLIAAWLIAAVLLASIAAAPAVPFGGGASTRPAPVVDVATQRFDLKTPDAIVRHGVESPLHGERGRGDDRAAGRRVIDVSSNP